jgi:hypothetical protein
MSKLLLNLRMVLEDEVEDVRAMLGTHGIEFYETHPSRWGISYGGIWVTHDRDLARAKALMADYQVQRRECARAERATAVQEGSAETFASTLRREPARVVLTLLAILALLGLVALVPLLLMHH